MTPRAQADQLVTKFFHITGDMDKAVKCAKAAVWLLLDPGYHDLNYWQAVYTDICGREPKRSIFSYLYAALTGNK